MPIAPLTTTSRLCAATQRGDVRALRGRFAGRAAGSVSVRAMAEAVQAEAVQAEAVQAEAESRFCAPAADKTCAAALAKQRARLGQESRE
jgi:membrane protease subunit (stomatin/prohibitin family)